MAQGRCGILLRTAGALNTIFCSVSFVSFNFRMSIDSPYYHGYIDIEIVISRLQNKPIGAYLVWQTGDCHYVISYIYRENDIKHSFISIEKKSKFIKLHPEVTTYQGTYAALVPLEVLAPLHPKCNRKYKIFLAAKTQLHKSLCLLVNPIHEKTI